MMKKYLILMGLFASAGNAMPAHAVGVCPEIDSYTDLGVKRVNSLKDTLGSTIYFCQQSFPSSSLAYAPMPTDVVAGGSQSISQAGSAMASIPLGTSSINLTGFTPANLALNSLSANFPNTNGLFNSPSLFNFYTRISSNGDCNNSNGISQYTYILQYLRGNPSIFQANSSGNQTAVADNSSSTSIAKINGALMVNAQGKTMPVAINLYYANPITNPQQQFTRTDGKYCWVGVGAQVSINGSDIKDAGDYKVTVGVLTQ